MDAILECCCGLDVHKSKVVACIAYGPLHAAPKFEFRQFNTMTSGLLELSDWMKEYGVTTVAMESTGIYWKPIFNIIENEFEVILANAQQIKNVPGRKTDMKDSQWIAMLLRCGLVPRSFIPPRPIRDLRDLTRTRRSLVQERTREKNRFQKVLEDANIKITSVVTDPFGVSSIDMIESLLRGDIITKEEIKRMARGQLKKKTPQLVEALNGNLSSHHKFLLTKTLERIRFLDQQISDYDAEIAKRCKDYQEKINLLKSIPGVSEISACSIISEIGVDMSRFPNEAHISSWAGVCPGNNESAGKKKSGKIRKGNSNLKSTLTECAWASSRTKDSSFNVIYNDIARRRGRKRALVAVGHRILVIAYRVLKTGIPYHDIGREAILEEKLKNRELLLIRKVEMLGYTIVKSKAEA